MWLEAVGEHVGTALENFSIAERVGILSISSEQMLEIRTIRNRLTHEYIENAKEFSSDVNAAIKMIPALIETLEKLVMHYRAVIRKA